MSSQLTPAAASEVVDALRATTGAVRLVGGGSRQHRLPPAADATRLAFGEMAAIERVDAGDQTCTVEPGVGLAELEAAVGRHDLELPCAWVGSGTVGGLFAADPIGAVTVGGPQPRSLVLGIEGVLSDGTEFRSGARVTKSVAGFDLHRLFVGSAGRLFAVTRLHLRLKPRPPESLWFSESMPDPTRALARFQELRALAAPPTALHFVHDETGGCEVISRFTGRPSFVTEVRQKLDLPEGRSGATFPFVPAGDTNSADNSVSSENRGEILAGIVRPSRVKDLLAHATTVAAPGGRKPVLVLHGGGRFEMRLPNPAATDAVIADLPSRGAHACIVAGAPERLGRGTPADPGAARLEAQLTRALDPDGRLR